MESRKIAIVPLTSLYMWGESHDHIVNNEKKINLRTSINRCMDALPFHTTKRKKKKEKIVKNVHTKACTSSYT
jgi:hypothetical protein